MPRYDIAHVIAHIVDLNRSKWDPKRSDRAKGIYYFEPGNPRAYVKKSDYDDKASRPPYIIRFIDIERLSEYRADFGAEPLTINDPYWPEHMIPNAEGQYSYKDGMFVKILDMEGFIDFRQAERNRGHGGFAEASAEFDRETASINGAELTDQDKRDLRIKK